MKQQHEWIFSGSTVGDANEPYHYCAKCGEGAVIANGIVRQRIEGAGCSAQEPTNV
jgi:hypothetical protein